MSHSFEHLGLSLSQGSPVEVFDDSGLQNLQIGEVGSIQSEPDALPDNIPPPNLVGGETSPSVGVVRGFIHGVQNRLARRSLGELVEPDESLNFDVAPQSVVGVGKLGQLARRPSVIAKSSLTAGDFLARGGGNRIEYDIPPRKTHAQYMESGDELFNIAERREVAGGLAGLAGLEAAIGDYDAARTQYTGALGSVNLITTPSGENVEPDINPRLALKLGLCYLKMGAYEGLTPYPMKIDEDGKVVSRDRREVVLNSSIDYLEQAGNTSGNEFTEKEQYVLLNGRAKAYQLRALHRERQGLTDAAEADRRKGLDGLIQGKSTISSHYLTEELQRLIESTRDRHNGKTAAQINNDPLAQELAIDMVTH